MRMSHISSWTKSWLDKSGQAALWLNKLCLYGYEEKNIGFLIVFHLGMFKSNESVSEVTTYRAKVAPGLLDRRRYLVGRYRAWLLWWGSQHSILGWFQTEKVNMIVIRSYVSWIDEAQKGEAKVARATIQKSWKMRGKKRNAMALTTWSLSMGIETVVEK